MLGGRTIQWVGRIACHAHLVSERRAARKIRFGRETSTDDTLPLEERDRPIAKLCCPKDRRENELPPEDTFLIFVGHPRLRDERSPRSRS